MHFQQIPLNQLLKVTKATNNETKFTIRGVPRKNQLRTTV